jgi:hypothetical protein
MRKMLAAVLVAMVLGVLIAAAAIHGSRQPATYLGFDRNEYPGDQNLRALRRSFDYTGYWLNTPPGASANSWQGKRKTVEREGFGFLLLFNGRVDAELKGAANPGAPDGAAAAKAAKAEGFGGHSVIFLDQEEGGRMLDEQKQYVFAWADAVRAAGYRPGVYCSGIEFTEPDGTKISTARDLHDSAGGGELLFWVANDACPPSPGCGFAKAPPPPEGSGAGFAEVWQFAQSPLRAKYAAGCAASYDPDGNCYAAGTGADRKLHLDVNSARVADPSHGRR